MSVRSVFCVLATMMLIAAGSLACNPCDTGTCGQPLHIIVTDGVIPAGGTLTVSSGELFWNCSASPSECDISSMPGFTMFKIGEKPEKIRIRILDAEGVLLRQMDVRPQYTTSAEPICQPSCRNFAEVLLENE